MSRWNSERWQHTGTSTAGDPVYTRSAPGEEAGGGYDAMTKSELQALLEERGLPKSGTKEELIERLNG